MEKQGHLYKFPPKHISLANAYFIITSTNSGVNLNGELSKPRFFGDADNIKP